LIASDKEQQLNSTNTYNLNNFTVTSLYEKDNLANGIMQAAFCIVSASTVAQPKHSKLKILR